LKIKRSEKNSHNDGFILIMILLLLTLLSVLAFELSKSVAIESKVTLAGKERVSATYLARAGLQRAAAELLKRSYLLDLNEFKKKSNKLWEPGDSEYTQKLSTGFSILKIRDESGKMNLNYPNTKILKKLFKNLEISQKDIDIIVDSLKDWIDRDKLKRLNGAEDDYYKRLNLEYLPKNELLESLEEALLIRGFSKKNFLEPKRGESILWDFFTIYTKGGNINLNSAPAQVIAALPGMSESLAKTLVKFRKNDPFENNSDIKMIIGESIFLKIFPYCTLKESGIYEVISIGKLNEKDPGITIRAIIEIFQEEKYKDFRFLYIKQLNTMA
jgi:type II secretory pathway component PulK